MLILVWIKASSLCMPQQTYRDTVLIQKVRGAARQNVQWVKKESSRFPEVLNNTY